MCECGEEVGCREWEVMLGERGGWGGKQEAGNDDEHENSLGDIRYNLRSLCLKSWKQLFVSLPSVLLLIHDLSITVEIALRWWRRLGLVG